jgi:hypothetical protein
LCVSIIVIVQYINQLQLTNAEGFFQQKYKDYMDQTIVLRRWLIFGQILLFLKFQQFLQLIDQVAPLIQIIFQIMADILWFMFILILFCIMFTFSFYLLAQNQLDFDNIPKAD